MSRAIRDRVEQEAVQRRSAPMNMVEKASDLAPPDLPTTLESCHQTDPGVLTSDMAELGFFFVLGLRSEVCDSSNSAKARRSCGEELALPSVVVGLNFWQGQLGAWIGL